MTDDTVSMVLDDARERMAKVVTRTRADFGNVRTGRAAPALVEKLPVEYYGSNVPLQQLAGFSVPEARMLVVTPYDKAAIGAIEKAIRLSDLGLNPSNDGINIRLSFPPLTSERRKEFVKVVKGMAEEGRVAVRNLRRSGRQELEAFEKDGDLSEDELARAEKELDKLTHTSEAEIDAALSIKEQELRGLTAAAAPLELQERRWTTSAGPAPTTHLPPSPVRVCASSAPTRRPRPWSGATWRPAGETTSSASVIVRRLHRSAPGRRCGFRSTPAPTPPASSGRRSSRPPSR
jgi:ribosome recycling factor